jgi:hypothetical protein
MDLHRLPRILRVQAEWHEPKLNYSYTSPVRDLRVQNLQNIKKEALFIQRIRRVE